MCAQPLQMENAACPAARTREIKLMRAQRKTLVMQIPERPGGEGNLQLLAV